MSSGTNLEIDWFTEFSSSPIGASPTGEIQVRGRNLIVERWEGGDEVFVGDTELFGNGPARLLVLRHSSRPSEALLVGEEGSELLRLDLDRSAVSRIAELPRDPNRVGGMCFLSIRPLRDVTLVHWELGCLALDDDIELRWRHDLEWNHQIIHLDDDEIWFDLLYESEDLPQRIGDEP